MNREVLLFAEEIAVESVSLLRSKQAQIFTGHCPNTQRKILIKQFSAKDDY